MPGALAAAGRLARWPAPVRYGVATALAAGAVAVGYWLAMIDAPAIYAPVLLVVAAAIWVLGVRAAGLALALGAAGVAFFVLEPRGSFRIDEPHDLVGWVAFMLTGFTILALGTGLRVAHGRAEDARRRSDFLADASLALDLPDSMDGRLERLAQLAVPRVADWCAVELAGPEPRLAAVAGADPARLGVGVSSTVEAPLAARGRLLGTLTLVTTGERRLDEDDRRLASELGRRAGLAVDDARLLEEERRAVARLRALQRVTAALGSALTSTAAAEAVVHEGMRALGADAGTVAIGREGALNVIVAVGYPEERVAHFDDIQLDAPLPGPEAARTGELVTISSRPEREARYPALDDVAGPTAFGAAVAAPLLVDGDARGFLGFSFDAPRAFDDADEAFLRSMARVASAALERAGAYDTQREIAQILQHSLLPGRLPDPDGLELGVRYVPLGSGTEVGGDFYDVIELGDEVLLVIGDVSGKGVAAATLTALARHTLRALAVPGTSPANLLRRLNVAVRRDDAMSGRFVTVAVAALSRAGAGWDVRACCAGHPPPLVARPNGRIEVLGLPGMLIGPFPEGRLQEVRGHLAPGDALVMHTDGVTEARRDGVMFGDARLRRLLSDRPGPADAIAEAIRRAVVAYRGNGLQDDLAVLVAVAR